ncbi:MAG: hypothetical protein QOF57_1779, partial [Frankiaceae bacterium]|nr:hypothetical protein [Frankiaceae bacterium]
RELTGAASATVSPDGASLYVPAIRLELAGGIIEQLTGGMAILDRAPDGTLSQPAGMAGCVTETGGSCTDGTAVDGAASVAFSADGRNAYVAAQASNAVAVFDRRSGPPPPPPPGPGVDVTRPLLRGLSLSPARFRALARGPAVVTRGGSRIAYGLSEPARVRFTIQLVVAGRRAGGRCVPVRRSNRSARRCDRYRTLGGSFTHTGATGRNALRFSGRLRNRKLAAERYRLRAVASDATGNRSGAKVARFAIRR